MNVNLPLQASVMLDSIYGVAVGGGEVVMICRACQTWIIPFVDKQARTLGCPDCGYLEQRQLLPLFIVTGPSGVGKTTIVPELQCLLPDWLVFETDILWDSHGDWNTIKCNWLHIANFLAQSGRLTILCGTMQPMELESCPSRIFFSTIYWLALHCDPQLLADRLRARPVWRGCDEDFIARHQQYLQWFVDNATTAFEPPLTLLDTTNTPVVQTAQQIRDWAVDRWRQEQAVEGMPGI